MRKRELSEGLNRGVSHHFGHYEDYTYWVLRIAYCVLRIRPEGPRKVKFNVTLKGDISIDLAAGVHHGLNR